MGCSVPSGSEAYAKLYAEKSSDGVSPLSFMSHHPDIHRITCSFAEMAWNPRLFLPLERKAERPFCATGRLGLASFIMTG